MQKLRPIKYKPLSFQNIFHKSTAEKVYLSGGYGCGKTYSLCMKALKLAHINKGMPGGFLAPNLKMFKKDVLPTMREITQENGIPFRFNQQDSIMHFPGLGVEVYVFHDEDKGASIRGPNLAWMGINEVTLIAKETFDAALARVRLKKANLLQTVMSGTPEGFNWAYEYFIENQRSDTQLIFGSTRENIHVHSSYVGILQNSYDELMIEQYLDGKFVNLAGRRALWAFDRFKYVKKDLMLNPGYPIWVSLDFNLNPMAATVWNYFPGEKVKLRAVEDICLKTSNTDEMAQVLLSRYGTNITIYPDPAGSAGSTKSKGKSDIQILKDYGFHDIKYKRSITSVRDCLNAFNRMLSRGEIEIGAQCKNIIADAEQCILKKDSVNLDKTNPMRTHWLDGAKDMIDYEFPIKAKSGSWREVQIR
jgi:hypothetical protein